MEKRTKAKLVYKQQYSRGRSTEAAYGKVKGNFFGDVIHLQLPDNGEVLSLTPNEAMDIIRALSAAVHHYLTDPKAVPIAKVIRYLEKHP